MRGLLLCAAGALLLAARRRLLAGQPRRVPGYVATRTNFGGRSRVQLRTGGGPRRRLVAFLYQGGR